MENSSRRSSNGTPSPVWVPPYVRLNSEVVEKPYEEDCRVVPEPEMAELSPAVLFPGSPASTKSDNEGIVHFISVLSQVDMNHVPPAHSDGEMEQGDVDEGFDEEFEDKDINEPEPEPNNQFQLGDLDPKELQQLLQLPNLEDFDLGVDVLDSEQPPILSPPMSHYSPVPTSPYHQGVVSPVPASPYHQGAVSPAPLSMNTYYNDYNLSESFGSEDPPSVRSDISALTSASLKVEDLSLAMLASECNMLPDSTSGDMLGDCHTVNSVTTAYHSPEHQQQSSPILTTAATPAGGLDLSETSQLLSADTLLQLSTALSSDAIVDTHSMYMFGNGSAHLNFSPTTRQNGSSSTNGITLLEPSILPMCSRPSQTLSSNERHTPLSPSPSPAPQHLAQHPAALRTPVSPGSPNRRSLSPAPSPQSGGGGVSEEDQKLIDMPYYQFRKLLDDPSIPERRKEDIKNIRRKGRNKAAAKVCRTKKLNLIVGLEKEVEQLRKAKSQISIKTITLEREIAELKKKCLNR